MNGGLEIDFDACPRSGRTRLKHLHQQAPLRALFPLCTGMDLPVAATGGVPATRADRAERRCLPNEVSRE